MPDVVGDSEATATATLEAQGFNVTPVYEETDQSRPGTVIDQSPSGGTLVRLGTTVVLTIAKAPRSRPRRRPRPRLTHDPGPGAESRAPSPRFGVQCRPPDPVGATLTYTHRSTGGPLWAHGCTPNFGQ